MNLGEIRAAIADLLNTIPGVRAYPYRRDNYATATGDGNTAIMVVPGDPYVDYYGENATMTGAALGGQSDVRLMLQVRVPRVSEEAAQIRLDELISTGTGEARSIYDTLRPNDHEPQTLAGLIEGLGVISARVGIVEDTADGLSYVGADIDLQMTARRVI